MQTGNNILGTWQDCHLVTNLPFVVHETTVHSLEIQIFGNISVDKDANQSAIGHHEL